MRKLLGIIISIIIFSSCEKQNEMFFPPEVGDVTLYGVTAKTVYAESYIEDSKNIDVDECGFCVYPNDDKTDVRYVKAVLSNGMFSVKIDSLKPGTDYSIKSYARNAVGVGYSDFEKICKTSLSVAEISTNNVFDITPTTAVCGGNITSDGGLQVTERGVCWSTSHNPTIYNNRTIDGTGIGSFTSNITDLTNETTYYVRAYATNSMGTAYGQELQFTTLGTTGTLNGHEWVDLGLPSGTLWATCNIGATSPQEYGNYYAWGETSTKGSYTADNYTYSLNPTILPSSADAATANWGSGWRLPTKEEMEELLNNCSGIWTSQSSVNGRLFTGPNGNSIFLPAAGFNADSFLNYAGSSGYYWSSSLFTASPSYAWKHGFSSGNCGMYLDSRRCGLTVRAVCQSR